MSKGKVVTFGEVMLRFSTQAFARFIQSTAFDVTYAGAEANAGRSRESQPATNSFGLLRIHLPGPLPQPLALLARVVSLEPDGVVKVRFLPLPDAVVDQIDKLAFRRHRRKVAGQHRSGR